MMQASIARGYRDVQDKCLAKSPEGTKKSCVCTRRTTGGSKPHGTSGGERRGSEFKPLLFECSTAVSVFFRVIEGAKACLLSQLSHIFFFSGRVLPGHLFSFDCSVGLHKSWYEYVKDAQGIKLPRLLLPLFF
jgi:hypothetical protein